jgi:curved DNA-binding protein
MKDYYKILGVTASCSEEALRKSYRKLAMRYHPDQNPDDPAAEEKFKEVAEAYGVLTDGVKRKEYDRCRAHGGSFSTGKTSNGFSYSQEDILRDLFRDPRFQQLFSGLLNEFQRSGFRHSTNFVKKSFFGGKGGIFFGGIFLFGSLAGPLLKGAAKRGLPGKANILRKVGSTFANLLSRNSAGTNRIRSANKSSANHIKELDTTYHTPLTAAELRQGRSIRILVYGEEGEQTLKVTIPPLSKNGQKLRLRGKGRQGPLGKGDLYLHLIQKGT